jgi:hypothetical protein
MVTVPVYCSEKHAFFVLPDLLPDGFTLARYTEWEAFDRTWSGAPCAILVIPCLRSSDAFRRFAAAPNGAAGCRTILVTAPDPENVRHTAAVCLDEIVWIDAARRELPAAIERVLARDPLREAAAMLGRAADVTPRLREALLYACHAERAPRTISGLAAVVGCDRTTLCRHWRATVGEGCEMRLQDCLDWLLLVRALNARAAGLTWQAVVDRLGVHLRSISRSARRLSGRSLGMLAADPLASGRALTDRFSTFLAAPAATFCPLLPHNVN